VSHSVTLKHNFETSHRLPHLQGKCCSLHGHSWWVEVTLNAPGLTGQNTLVEFGVFKGIMREYIDRRLDHGTMLGAADPLLPALVADPYGCKVFTFGPGGDWNGAAWPTVEAVAHMLADQAAGHWLPAANSVADVAEDVYVARVKVTETHVNAAEWIAS
jgi:6-pyruvoyltetrahydropterin/6-carboxytetrahydropterin synthase